MVKAAVKSSSVRSSSSTPATQVELDLQQGETRAEIEIWARIRQQKRSEVGGRAPVLFCVFFEPKQRHQQQ